MPSANNTVSPGYFGTVDLQSVRSLALEISNSGNTPLEVFELDLQGEAFRIDVEAPFTVDPGEIRVVEVTFLPLAAGEDSGLLRIESDGVVYRERVMRW